MTQYKDAAHGNTQYCSSPVTLSGRFCRYLLLFVALLCLFVFSGCFEGKTGNISNMDRATATGSEKTKRPTHADLSLSAGENKHVFDMANKSVFDLYKKGGLPEPIELVDALVRVGFLKSSIQVTDNKTTLGAYAYSMSVSVFLHNRCLLGQFTRSTGEYSSSVMKPVGTTDLCLVGTTADIK